MAADFKVSKEITKQRVVKNWCLIEHSKKMNVSLNVSGSVMTNRKEEEKNRCRHIREDKHQTNRHRSAYQSVPNIRSA